MPPRKRKAASREDAEGQQAEQQSTGYWLCKSEPHVFSFEELKQKGAEAWDGVRNAQVTVFQPLCEELQVLSSNTPFLLLRPVSRVQARNHLQQQQLGDLVCVSSPSSAVNCRMIQTWLIVFLLQCFFYHSNCKVPGIAGVAKVGNPAT